MSNIPRYSGVYYNPTGAVGPNPFWLPQLTLSSFSNLYETASRTTLSQTFVNPSNVAPITGAKYTFPMYESCAIVAFRCYVGTRLIEGVVKEKEDASLRFQEAVERNEPASLLEQHTPDVFSTSLGNISPGETVKIEIEYIMELKHDAEVDGLRFTIPTSIAPRYGPMPSGLSAYETSPGATVNGISISVAITMSNNVQSVRVCVPAIS